MNESSIPNSPDQCVSWKPCACPGDAETVPVFGLPDFSLTPDEFKQMVDSIRVIEKSLGKVKYGCSAESGSWQGLALSRELGFKNLKSELKKNKRLYPCRNACESVDFWIFGFLRIRRDT